MFQKLVLIENDRGTLTNSASCLQFYGDTTIASVLLDDPQLPAELKYILKEPLTFRASQLGTTKQITLLQLYCRLRAGLAASAGEPEKKINLGKCSFIWFLAPSRNI